MEQLMSLNTSRRIWSRFGDSRAQSILNARQVFSRRIPWQNRADLTFIELKKLTDFEG
jgi:hypothetical protein